MKVLIIEDEAPAFRRLEKILEEVEPSIEILDVIDSVEDAVKWLNNHQHPDLIFMDIQLSDGISFSIFDQVELSKPVIFTTAFDEYMLKAFKVNSVDYLLKPIKKEDLAQSIKKWKSLQQSNNPLPDLQHLVKQIRLNERQYKTRFLVKNGEKLISIETDQIAYFFTHNAVVYMMSDSGKKYLMDQTLDDIMAGLNPEKFYRANRQFIVQFPFITAVHKYHKGKLLIEIKPKSEEEILVSAEKATDFKKWLGD